MKWYVGFSVNTKVHIPSNGHLKPTIASEMPPQMKIDAGLIYVGDCTLSGKTPVLLYQMLNEVFSEWFSIRF